MWGNTSEKLAHAIWARFVVGTQGTECDVLPPFAHLQRLFVCSRHALVCANLYLEEKGIISRDLKRKAWHIHHDVPLPVTKRRLGVVIPIFEHDVIKNMLEGLQSTAEQLGADIVLMKHELSLAGERNCIETLIKADCCGLVVYPCNRNSRQKTNDYLLTERYGIPIVMADYDYSEHGYPTVGIDNYQLGFDVTQTLIQMGHQRIAFMSFPLTPDSAPNGAVPPRYRGYRNAMANSGFSVMPEDLLVVRNTSLENLIDPMADYLENWNQNGFGATAMIALDDFSAQQILQIAEERRIELKGRLALAGFDNMVGLQDIPIALSTHSDFYTLGRIAARIALYGIQSGHYRIPANVIIRHNSSS
ncbi:MAG: LacI family DNA-binding transcriptional regulator [Armatimonadota bacterium]